MRLQSCTLALLLLAVRAQAQSCARGSGSVVGRLVAEGPDIRLQRGVFAEPGFHDAIADRTGRFRISCLAPGAYRVVVGDLGVRHVTPVPITIQSDSTVTLEIRLHPENAILDCRADTACARILQAPQAGVGQASPLDDSLVVLRTALAVSALHSRESGATHVCVALGSEQQARDMSSEMLHNLQISFHNVHRRSDCEASKSSGRALEVRGTGDRAWVTTLTRLLARGSGEYSVEFTYHVGPLWAGGWSCTFQRIAGALQPVTCRMDWIL